jgi:hypothetical protein
MAFPKTADAIVQKPMIGLDTWNNKRHNALLKQGTEFMNRSASIAIENYIPEQYLLTHCTIIASVDVDTPNVKTGEVEEDGQKINRPHADYLIKPDCNKYINQNGDAWERKLLMSTYKTFVGAENYVEHIQIPELSKGKVIDAVARDLGDTVYIDILVATDRSHEDLVRSIEAGELNTLSMGCTIAYSVCTKCGNKAADETELCRHIKYEKGNKFVGPNGKIRIVAELCGHHTDPDSVHFIEASWVGNPAFKGAVLRNVLDFNKPETKEPTPYEHDQLQNLIQQAHTATPTADWTDAFLKTASAQIRSEIREELSAFANRNAFGGGGDDEEEEDSGGGDEGGAIEEVSDELKEKVKKKVIRDLKDEMKKEDGGNGGPPNEDTKAMPEAERAPNDSIHHSYKLFASHYLNEIGDDKRTKRAFAILRLMQKDNVFLQHKSRFANTDIVTAMYLYDRDGLKSPQSRDLYLCLQKVGGASNYSSLREFLGACIKSLGRKPSQKEALFLIKRAKILN